MKKRRRVKEVLTRELKQEIKEKIEEERTWRDMRILWHSVSPHIFSGYGKVTKYTLAGLLNRGFVAFCSAYYGVQAGGIVDYKGIYVLPVVKHSLDKLGFKTVAEHYKRFQCDLGVFHADFWVSYKFPKLIPNSLVYSPIDQEHYPEKWLDILRAYKWVAVPSKHGQKELKKSGIEATFIPHGVDTKVYRPLDKSSCRKAFTLEKDKFIIGIVAANNDDEPRKGWDSMFQAIKIFLDNNPDAKKDVEVVIHSDPENEKGRNLIELSKQVGIHDKIIWNDRYVSSVIGLPESAMARLYNCFDVFLMLSRREGFCLPVLEAQACGVPCIVNGFSALIERVNNGKCGWLVPPRAYVYSPLNAITSIPDPEKGADALEEAYNKDSKRKYFAKRGLEYARKQTWDIAIDKYWLPFLERIGEEIPHLSSKRFKSLEERKIAGN